MKNRHTIYEVFLSVLREKVPEKGRLAKRLMDILQIEKEAVYRRLRGDVPFSFAEIIRISVSMEISLDNLVKITSPKSSPFQLKLVDFLEPEDIDVSLLDNYVKILDDAKDDPVSEFGLTTNVLPSSFITRFTAIYRFYLMKWSYQHGNKTKKYAEVKPVKSIMDINRRYYDAVQYISDVYYIFDELIFVYLINDINYFRSINLITEEEIRDIKRDIFICIDELEELAANGRSKQNKKVSVYVSSINFEENYSCVLIKDCHLSIVKVLVFNEIASIERRTYLRLRTFLQSLKRSSTLISESGEMQRIIFFEKQRELISKL